MHSIILRFSPDGSRFAIAGRELQTLRFFDTFTLEEVLVISRDADAYIRDTHFTPDGRQFLISTDTLIRSWDTASGEELAAIPGSGRIALHPNGTQLIAFRAIDNVSALQIWNTADFTLGEQLSLSIYQTYWAQRTRFNADSDGLITVGWDRIIHRNLNGVITRTLRFTPPTADYFNTESSASYPKFSQNVHFVLLPHIQASGIEAFGGRMMLLDLEHWNVSIIPDIYTWNVCSDISSTGRFGAFDTGGMVNPVISIWNLEELHGIQTDVVVGYGRRCALIFSPDESLLAVSYMNANQPQFALLEPTTGEIIRSKTVDISYYGAPLFFSSSSDTLITLTVSQQGNTSSIQLWDVPSLTISGTITPLSDESVRRVALTPDGSILAGGGEDGTLWLWNFYTGELLFAAHAYPSRIADLFFSLDGTLLFTQNIDGATYLWGIPTDE
jgi:WD40 repeat protein